MLRSRSRSVQRHSFQGEKSEEVKTSVTLVQETTSSGSFVVFIGCFFTHLMTSWPVKFKKDSMMFLYDNNCNDEPPLDSNREQQIPKSPHFT